MRGDLSNTTGAKNPIKEADPTKINPEILRVFLKDYQGKVTQLPDLLSMKGCNSQFLDFMESHQLIGHKDFTTDPERW